MCRSIQRWVRKNSKLTNKLIKEKTEALEKIHMGTNPYDKEGEQVLKDEIHLLLEQEDIRMKQRAKMDWLHEGDRNTKFFHACVKQRKCKNCIEKIDDGVGRSCTSQESIEQAFIGYYSNLFAMAGATNIEVCIQAITCKVTLEMNTQLEAPFNAEEVYQALQQMAPLKALGLDGFSTEFFQKNWSTIGPEVCNAVIHYLIFLKMEPSINETHIALIPKKQPQVVFLISGRLAFAT
jgi:hypothetical protein